MHSIGLCVFRKGFELTLEREYDVPNLGTPARFLQFRERPATAVGDPHLGDLLVGYGIIRIDIFRPNDAGDVNAGVKIHQRPE